MQPFCLKNFWLYKNSSSCHRFEYQVLVSIMYWIVIKHWSSILFCLSVKYWKGCRALLMWYSGRGLLGSVWHHSDHMLVTWCIMLNTTKTKTKTKTKDQSTFRLSHGVSCWTWRQNVCRFVLKSKCLPWWHLSPLSISITGSFWRVANVLVFVGP